MWIKIGQFDQKLLKLVYLKIIMFKVVTNKDQNSKNWDPVNRDSQPGPPKEGS